MSEIFDVVGEEGFTKLVAEFYSRVKTDDLLGPLYPQDDFENAERRLRERVAVPVHAYTYTFNNKSDKDAEVQFKLAGVDEPTETVKVAANNSASITISVWNRAGLCIELESIKIRFFPDDFKKPWLTTEAYGSQHFDYVVQNKKMPPEYAVRRISAENAAHDSAWGAPMQCLDRTYDFTYVEQNTYPVLRHPA